MRLNFLTTLDRDTEALKKSEKYSIGKLLVLTSLVFSCPGLFSDNFGSYQEIVVLLEAIGLFLSV